MKLDKEMFGKDELILNKQIRQSTTKILRRPSYFQSGGQPGGGVVSPEVLKALLERRKSGKLANSSTLQDWVNRFEKEYNEFNNKNAKEYSYEYIERQFQALHEELTNNDGQTTVGSPAGLSHHQPLDSSPAKHKLKLSRQRAQSKDRKSSKDDISSPKQGARFQATNVIRQHISNSSTTSLNQTSQKPLTLNTANLSSVNQSINFELGKEPDVHSNINKQEIFLSKSNFPHSSHQQISQQSSAKSSVQNNKVTAGLSQAFVSRLAGTLAGRNKSPKLDNEYEEIPSYAQVKKTPRKPKKQAPTPDGLYEEISLYQSTMMASGSNTFGANNQGIPMAALRHQLGVDTQQDTDTETDTEEFQNRKKKAKGPIAPFEKFQNCLFSVFTTCTPWCVMRQVYWKKDEQSEEIFTIRSRQNRRQKRTSVISSPPKPTDIENNQF